MWLDIAALVAIPVAVALWVREYRTPMRDPDRDRRRIRTHLNRNYPIEDN